ncbi:MAG TPA: hypothetical protein VIY51_16635 [Xanthobacteraceae bacterium]
MCRSTYGTAAAGLIAGAFCMALTADVAAQSSAPDFSANQAAWIATSNDFIAPAQGPKPVSFDPAHPYVPNNPRRQATFRIADLSNPNLRPWAKEQMQKSNAAVLGGKVAFTPRSSCLPAGVPAFMLFIVEPVFFVQSQSEVLIIYSGDQQVRHVYLDVPHSANPKPSWYGESVGHYENGALVIDTVGFNERTFVDNYRTPHTDKLHVVERWQLVDGGRILEVALTVDDPDTFLAPWSGIQRYRRIQETMGEQVCAENNTAALFDYHVPVADKPDF